MVDEDLIESIIRNVEAGLDVVSHEERGWAVVRIHVRVEADLWRGLRARVARPDVLPDRMSWASLARWAVAMDVLPREYLDPLLRLNSLRNKVAHAEDGEVTDDEIEALVAAWPARFVAKWPGEAITSGHRFSLTLGQLYALVHAYAASAERDRHA